MEGLRNPPLPFPPTQALAQIEQGLQRFKENCGFTKEEAISHMMSERERQLVVVNHRMGD